MEFFLLMFVVVMVLSIAGMGAGSRRRSIHMDPYQQGPPLGYPGDPMAQRQLPAPYGPQFGAPYGAQYQQPDYPMAPATRAALDSDITTYGDELRELDFDVVGRELSAEARQDYTRALDAYDGAKNQLARAQFASDVRRITQILDDGRYAIASVKARVNGQPLPEHRPPCFFDPAHGPSVENVQWAPPGGAARAVPACAADVARIRMGNDPSIRLVPMGAQQVPYWENQQYAPWVQGYYGRYGMDPALRQITHGALMIGGFSLLMGFLDG